MEDPFRCGSPALASRKNRLRSADDMAVEISSPRMEEPRDAEATPTPPREGVKAHRFAAGRAMALLQAARKHSTTSSPSHSPSNSPCNSPTAQSRCRSDCSSPFLVQWPETTETFASNFQGPLCPPNCRPRTTVERPRPRISCADFASDSTRAVSPASDEIETQRWPSYELDAPTLKVKLSLPIGRRTGDALSPPLACSWTDEIGPTRATDVEETPETAISWRPAGHVPIDCVIRRRRKKRAKEKRLALPFAVPREDSRFEHLVNTEGQPGRVRTISIPSFPAWAEPVDFS